MEKKMTMHWTREDGAWVTRTEDVGVWVVLPVDDTWVGGQCETDSKSRLVFGTMRFGCLREFVQLLVEREIASVREGVKDFENLVKNKPNMFEA